MDRKQIKEYQSGFRSWSCSKCVSSKLFSDHQTIYNTGTDDHGNPFPKSKVAHDKLRILQWNADGLRNKIMELRAREGDLDLDVLLIQETHLEPNKATPTIPGYAALKVLILCEEVPDLQKDIRTM